MLKVPTANRNKPRWLWAESLIDCVPTFTNIRCPVGLATRSRSQAGGSEQGLTRSSLELVGGEIVAVGPAGPEFIDVRAQSLISSTNQGDLAGKLPGLVDRAGDRDRLVVASSPSAIGVA